MTEEQIRQIVRDEIEAECIRPDGIYDQARRMAFTTVRTVSDLIAARMGDLWGPDRKGDLN